MNRDRRPDQVPVQALVVVAHVIDVRSSACSLEVDGRVGVVDERRVVLPSGVGARSAWRNRNGRLPEDARRAPVDQVRRHGKQEPAREHAVDDRASRADVQITVDIRVVRQAAVDAVRKDDGACDATRLGRVRAGHTERVGRAVPGAPTAGVGQVARPHDAGPAQRRGVPVRDGEEHGVVVPLIATHDVRRREVSVWPWRSAPRWVPLLRWPGKHVIRRGRLREDTAVRRPRVGERVVPARVGRAGVALLAVGVHRIVVLIVYDGVEYAVLPVHRRQPLLVAEGGRCRVVVRHQRGRAAPHEGVEVGAEAGVCPRGVARVQDQRSIVHTDRARRDVRKVHRFATVEAVAVDYLRRADTEADVAVRRGSDRVDRGITAGGRCQDCRRDRGSESPPRRASQKEHHVRASPSSRRGCTTLRGRGAAGRAPGAMRQGPGCSVWHASCTPRAP